MIDNWKNSISAGCSHELLKKRIIAIVNYEYTKISSEIEIDSPTFSHHGKTVVVRKKFKGRVEGFIKGEGGVWVKLNPSSIKFIPQPEQEELKSVKVGDIVCIRLSNYRPRYDEDSLFVVVWKGSKYVRVKPRFPKYEVYTKPSKNEKKPGDNTYEIDPKKPSTYWNSGCYNTDVPLNQIYYPTQYDQEDIDLAKDMGELGI